MSKSGDYNPSSPNLQGLELRPSLQGVLHATVNNGGYMQRIRPGAITPTQVHTFLASVTGAPGLGIEIIDTIAPARTDEIHFPGTDTGATKSAWQTLASGTSTFAAIDDDFDDTDGLRNISAVGRNSSIQLKFRGADTALTSKRIDRVQIWVRCKTAPSAGTSRRAQVHGCVNLGGTDYTASPGVTVAADGLTRTIKIADWQLNPATHLPWTMADVNLFVASGATDEFGLVVDTARLAVQAFNVYGMKVVVTAAPENRRGYLYANGTPRQGWSRNTLSGTGGLSSNTYYWLLVYALRGSTRNSFDVPVLFHPGMIIQTDPIATGEHRLFSLVTLTGPSGVIDSVWRDVPGMFMPGLVESSGPSINTQSQAYAKQKMLTFDANATVNQGTEITSASGSNPYAGVKVPIAWADPNTPPDQPLVFEVRDGAGMLTGAGNLRATSTFSAHSNPTWPNINPNGADAFVAFDGGNYTPGATTQQFILVKSAATPGKGWKVPRLDSRSDFIGTGAGTTAANVQGATQGGTTDSYSSNGTEDDRYDMPVVMVRLPDPPTGPVLTVRSAV